MKAMLLWVLVVLAAVALFAHGAKAQSSAPGWMPTGEWQCGPHVRVIVSSDGLGGLDWFVTGAWFDNHYTVRRGQLFYNAIPCAAVGNVWPPQPPPRKKQIAKDNADCNGDLPNERPECE